MLAQRLTSEDRIKLEQHADLINELEKRKLALLSGDRHNLWPDRSIIDPTEGFDWRAESEEIQLERWSTGTDVKMDLVAAALHADVTRVASLTLHQPPNLAWGYALGMFDSTDSHDLTHKVNDLSRSSPQSNDPEARGLIINEKHVLLAKLNRLVDQLSQLQEVDGSRMLDHTVIVLTSHIADGSHQLENLPWFTLGNLDGTFDTGQFITLEKGRNPNAPVFEIGRGHGDLYLTLANAMGLEMETFGYADACRGPIEEMLA
jgi:hypothetical protein